jgi:hypothetical protein
MRRLLIIILILTSCKPTEKSVTGTYTRYWDFENHTRLTLKRDKTFSFKTQEGLVFFELYGTWTIDKDKLVLNSPDDPSALSKSIIAGKKTVDKSGVTLRVRDGDDDLPGALIYVYTQGQKQEYSANESGQLDFKNEKWDSIQVSYVGLKSLTIKAGPENMYDIRLTREEPIWMKFKNERWTIRGRKLIDPRFNENRRKNTYRKNSR